MSAGLPGRGYELAADKRDQIAQSILRDWSKHPADLDDDGDFAPLSFEQQGVFLALLRYSQRRSQLPGWFLDPHAGTPLHQDKIVYDVAGRKDRIDAAQDGMAAAKRAGLLRYSAADGWEIVGYADRYATPKERIKIREGNRQRQQALRARRRRSNVVALPTAQSGGER